MSETRMWYLVCYDVRDPKRLRKTFKLLKGYGKSVQYSIFRCRMDHGRIERLRWELERILADDDRLTIIALCDNCADKVVVRNEESWAVEEPAFRVL